MNHTFALFLVSGWALIGILGDIRDSLVKNKSALVWAFYGMSYAGTVVAGYELWRALQ